MRADVSVHEPKQPVDDETPLSFSMEGLGVGQPSSLMTSSWSPGWNSNQSIQKFQDEAGGAIKGGSSGVRLIESGQSLGDGLNAHTRSVPTAFHPSDTESLLIPVYRVFGSDELSSQAPAIAEMSGDAQFVISSESAAKLEVVDGDGVSANINGVEVTLEACVDPSLAEGCVGFTTGMPGTESLVATAVGLIVSLRKADSWQRRKPQLIATDNPNAPTVTNQQSLQSGVSHV
jgi:NADH-quinone oxidoreductase subunit G